MGFFGQCPRCGDVLKTCCSKDPQVFAPCGCREWLVWCEDEHGPMEECTECARIYARGAEGAARKWAEMCNDDSDLAGCSLDVRVRRAGYPPETWVPYTVSIEVSVDYIVRRGAP